MLATLSVQLKKPTRYSLPTISVGNIHLGGTGKTPLVAQITRHFEHRKPAILSRGYRSVLSNQGAEVDLTQPRGFHLFGDEPWMLAKKTKASIYIGRNRKKLFRKYPIEKNCGLIILDDGFQHRQIARDVDVVVIPSDAAPVTDACLPLGNLREPLKSLRRASVAVVTTAEPDAEKIKAWELVLRSFAPGTPLFIARRKVLQICDEAGALPDPSLKVWGAFCGIANPHRFETDLKSYRTLQLFRSYPDHHPYEWAEVEALINEGKRKNVQGFVTTEKDFSKVKEQFKSAHMPLFVLEIEYELPPLFWQSLEEQVAKAC